MTITEIIKGINEYSGLIEAVLGLRLSLKPYEVHSEERARMIQTSKRQHVIVGENQDIETLSSSEASKIRILLEVNNAKVNGCSVVVIDEFDAHFDNDQIVCFMERLVEAFSALRFVFVIHNVETLVNLHNMDAFVFNIDANNSMNKIVDCNDISEIGQIHRMRSKYIGCKTRTEIILERCVAEVVKTGTISEELIVEYQKINKNLLSSREKVWYLYVQKKVKNENQTADEIRDKV